MYLDFYKERQFQHVNTQINVTLCLTLAAQVVMLRFGPEKVTSLEGVEEEEEGEEPEGEGTGSTELSDIRLLGRCGRETDRGRWASVIIKIFASYSS